MLFPHSSMLRYDGDDDDNPITPKPDSQGGPAAGSYGTDDPNMPIPGEGGTDNSHQ